MLQINVISAEETYGIRQPVLRPHQTMEACKFEGDHASTTFHIGAFHQQKLISIASFYAEAHPDFSDRDVYRLRGMATLEAYRGLGAGSLAVKYGQELLREKGISLLWCKARLPVRAYYEKLGFETHGDVFDIPSIGPHIVMYAHL